MNNMKAKTKKNLGNSAKLGMLVFYFFAIALVYIGTDVTSTSISFFGIVINIAMIAYGVSLMKRQSILPRIIEINKVVAWTLAGCIFGFLVLPLILFINENIPWYIILGLISCAGFLIAMMFSIFNKHDMFYITRKEAILLVWMCLLGVMAILLYMYWLVKPQREYILLILAIGASAVVSLLLLWILVVTTDRKKTNQEI